MPAGSGIRGETVDEILFLNQTDEPADEGMLWYNDGSFKARDGTGLFDLRSAGGITEAQHEALDTLVHFIDETSFDEFTYLGSRPTKLTTYDQEALPRKKIREQEFIYSLGKVSQIVTKQYDASENVKMTVTETFNYSGLRVASVTRVKS